MSGFFYDNVQVSMLGGGLPGGMPRGGLLGGGAGSTGGTGMEGGSTRGRDRRVLRRGFGRFKKRIDSNPRIITPFRQAFNAGDTAGTVNERTREAASNQLNGIAPVNSLRRYERSRGAASGGESNFTGNPKFVYDSSDYIRFKKLAAKNKTYNDKSFGGDESNGSYVSRMRNF